MGHAALLAVLCVSAALCGPPPDPGDGAEGDGAIPFGAFARFKRIYYMVYAGMTDRAWQTALARTRTR